MRLQDKVAIISGAASGMGAATARRFGKEGAKVVVADMLEEDGRKVAAGHHAANGAAEFMRAGRHRRGELEVRGGGDGGEVRPAGHPGEQRRHQRQRGDRHAGHRGVGPADGGERARRVPRHEIRRAGDEEDRRRIDRQSVVDLRQHRADDDAYGLQRVQRRGAHADQIDRGAVRRATASAPIRCIPG